ncbi:uncharacterized protein LAESUDRAFT_759132 [Laetiporus sulphureus 93-53]|uniref:Uncharacterized protein n=1 Tax=Laetiporus sulphureus 93-53 TaxID=1314785 RepID=A0A165EAW1_9APHY|nr:uncharacterized protein LAESUDRAFT_759132 [Laetiporus sulphureus 93-53]KZT06620.1 hypothetical protein LAESUDRAFT_759132 [Laetiporus sulphureus 93-53]
MLSFSAISVFATLALSAFTSAAPTNAAVPTAALVNGVSKTVPVHSVPSAKGLVPRDTKNVVTIINETTVKVTEYTVEFHYLTAANATIDIIEPIVLDIKAVLGDALTEINALVGESTSVILGTTDGVLLTVAEVAGAIVGLLTLILEAVAAVLAVVSSDALECVTALLAGLAEVLGCLVCAILLLVNGSLSGLISLIVSLAGDVLNILVTLKVTVLISILGITV